MNDLKEWIALAITSLGLDILALKSGLVGGFIALTYEKKRTPGKAAISILSGAILAGYLGPIAAHFFNLEGTTFGGVCFLVGLLSMRIVPVLFEVAEEKVRAVAERVTEKKVKMK